MDKPISGNGISVDLSHYSLGTDPRRIDDFQEVSGLPSRRLSTSRRLATTAELEEEAKATIAKETMDVKVDWEDARRLESLNVTETSARRLLARRLKLELPMTGDNAFNVAKGRIQNRLTSVTEELRNLDASVTINTCSSTYSTPAKKIFITCPISADSTAITSSTVAPIMASLALGFNVNVVIDKAKDYFLAQLNPTGISTVDLCTVVTERDLFNKVKGKGNYADVEIKSKKSPFAQEKVCPQDLSCKRGVSSCA